MVIDSTGKVGIGTATPTFGLDVVGSTRLTGAAQINSTVSGEGLAITNTAGFGSRITLKANTTDNSYFTHYNSSAGSGLSNNLGIGSSKSIVFFADADVSSGGTNHIQFRAGGNDASQERMRITSTGLVGIGTNSPTYKLQVQANNAGADGLQITNGTSSGSASIELINNNSVLGAFRSFGSTFSLSHFQNVSTLLANQNLAFLSDAASASGGTNTMKFYAGGYNANQERMRINSGGVNIGGAANVAASAVLEVTSTTKGVLFPRMTTSEKNAIASPAAGLVVYDTTLNKLCVYTTAWETITSL
jgi:hypothetical protein